MHDDPKAAGTAESVGPLARIAHDLRTPLTGIAAHLDLLARGSDGPLTESQQERIERLRACLDRMRFVTDQIADLALIESGRLRPDRRPVDLGEVLLHAIEEAERTAQSGPIDLHLALPPDPPRVLADPHRLRQILVTLILDALARGAEGIACTVVAGRPGVEGADRETNRPEGQVRVTLRPGPAGARTVRPTPVPAIGLVVAEALARAFGGAIAREDGADMQAAGLVLSLPTVGLASRTRDLAATDRATERDPADAVRDQRV